jgi:hypothetical protein
MMDGQRYLAASQAPPVVDNKLKAIVAMNVHSFSFVGVCIIFKYSKEFGVTIGD